MINFFRFISAISGLGVAFGASLILWILGPFIHLWASVIAYMNAGVWAAVLTLFLPFAAELYWGWHMWTANETLANPFCIAIAAWVFLFFLKWAFAMLVVIAEERWVE